MENLPSGAPMDVEASTATPEIGFNRPNTPPLLYKGTTESQIEFPPLVKGTIEEAPAMADSLQLSGTWSTKLTLNETSKDSESMKNKQFAKKAFRQKKATPHKSLLNTSSTEQPALDQESDGGLGIPKAPKKSKHKKINSGANAPMSKIQQHVSMEESMSIDPKPGPSHAAITANDPTCLPSCSSSYLDSAPGHSRADQDQQKNKYGTEDVTQCHPKQSTDSESGTVQEINPMAHKLEPICRYRIPDKILGSTVNSTSIDLITDHLSLVVKPIKFKNMENLPSGAPMDVEASTATPEIGLNRPNTPPLLHKGTTESQIEFPPLVKGTIEGDPAMADSLQLSRTWSTKLTLNETSKDSESMKNKQFAKKAFRQKKATPHKSLLNTSSIEQPALDQESDGGLGIPKAPKKSKHKKNNSGANAPMSKIQQHVSMEESMSIDPKPGPSHAVITANDPTCLPSCSSSYLNSVPGHSRADQDQQKNKYGTEDVTQCHPKQSTDSESGTVQEINPMAHKLEPICRFRIPDKILGSTVNSTSIDLITNHLSLVVKPIKFFRYTVFTVPYKPEIYFLQAFKTLIEKYFPEHLIAFDQKKNFYSLNPIKLVPENDYFYKIIEVTDTFGNIKKIKVTIKASGSIDLRTPLQYMQMGVTSMSQPMEAIQAIDTVLRQGTMQSYLKFGRLYFKRPENPIDLGCGLEVWTGLFQSATFATKGFVNIDVSHRAVPKNEKLIDLMHSDFEINLNRHLDDRNQNHKGVRDFKKFIHDLKVSFETTRKDGTPVLCEYGCNGLVNIPSEQFFTLHNPNGPGQRMSVAEYYANVKNYIIKHKQLSCVWLGPRNKTFYIPPELLIVTRGQMIHSTLDNSQLAKMSRGTVSSSEEGKLKIEDLIVEMKYTTSEFFKEFGLSIGDKLLPVVAKVLQPPRLLVGEKFPTIPNDGAWQSKGFFKAAALQSWMVIAIKPVTRSINYDRVIQMIMEIGGSKGMAIEKPMCVDLNVDFNQLFTTEWKNKFKSAKLIFIILSSENESNYDKIKTLVERELGVLTQCLRDATLRRPEKLVKQSLQQLVIKVNTKLMGINQTLDKDSIPRCLIHGDVMLVGADVTHPDRGQKRPSIAAVTASTDSTYYLYNSEQSVQTPRKEIIVQFEDMIADHLKYYKERNKSLPKKIFVFRDGVSDGQIAEVLNFELSAVYSAYQRMAGVGVKPQVLFVIVQKRHHTRLFDAKRNKVAPGTVVDTQIVHKRELEFYLISHQSKSGAARPTRYRVVCNDGCIPADEVEQLTYYLCHLYSRCMRNVSYPTPTYYAHIACLRARALTIDDQFVNLEENPQRVYVSRRLIKQSTMFFI